MGYRNYYQPVLQLTQRCIRRLIIGVIERGSKIKIPTKLDRIFGTATVKIIKLYQIVLSPWIGRACIFYPTCSNRCASLIYSKGWNDGVPAARAQVKRCCGTYSLSYDSGNLVFIALDGKKFSECELNPLFADEWRERMRQSLPHFGDEDFLRDLPAAADLQQRKLVGEVARRDLAFELDEGHLGTDEIDRQDMILTREALQLR